MNNATSSKVLLVIGDDKGIPNSIPEINSKFDFRINQMETVLAKDRSAILSAARKHQPAVALHNLSFEENAEGVVESFQCIEDIISACPSCKIIVMVEEADYANAMKAINMGAYDYCPKQMSSNLFNTFADNATLTSDTVRQSYKKEKNHFTLAGVIAGDPRMMAICDTVKKVAPANLTCMLLGESGTGKEVLARAIHRLSPRASNRFLAINCASVPENLIESELFGYEKGAFSGAANTTKGRIETAEGGTLFLDEIGDMPLSLQAKLLRFLQERVVERVGGRREIPVDVRVICATNRNLEKMVEDGLFREDLYYRVSEIIIDIPPLRDRQGDKILLAKYFVESFAREQNKNIIGFTRDALSAIENYSWPGNVREMENRLKRAIVLAENKFISSADLDLTQEEELQLNLRKVRQRAEQIAITRALAITQSNISAAAKLLGVSRPTLYDLLKKLDLKVYH